MVDELTGGAVTRTYTYGLQRISQDQVISNTWTPSYYGYDDFGSVRNLTNSAGAITDSYDYDAFGNKINSTGTTPNNMLYRGEEFDSDLGLYYLRARYMNPLSGRFMSRDPNDPPPAGLHRMPVDPKKLHKYLYAGGDPVNKIDPRGREDSEEYHLTLICGGSLNCGLSLTGRQIVGGGLILAIFGRSLADAFGWITERLEQALGPDLHDPSKEPGGPDQEPEPAPISSGP